MSSAERIGSLAAQELDSIVSNFSRFNENAGIIAAIAFFVYDYCLTCTREVKQIWRHELSLATILFALIRYAAFLLILVETFDLIQGRYRASELFQDGVITIGLQPISCRAYIGMTATMYILVFIGAAILSALRVYAMSSRNMWLAALTLTLALLTPAFWLRAYVGAKPPSSRSLSCVDALSSNAADFDIYMYLARIAAVAADASVVIVTYLTTWQTRIAAKSFAKAYHSGGQTPVVMVLIRDGSLYFAALVIASIITMTLDQNQQNVDVVSTWIAVLTSTLMSRFMLDIREASSATLDDVESFSLRTVVFQDSSMDTEMTEETMEYE